jgi:hypothetical protein
MFEMLKRLTLLVVTALLVVAGLGSAQPAPAYAASSLADLMPPETGAYIELRTADLDGSINKVLEIFRKADVPIPKDIYAQIDAQLSQVLNRDFKIAKNLYPLLGDSLAVGVIFPDELLQKPTTTTTRRAATPGVLVAMQIKDDASLTSLIAELRTLAEKRSLKLTSEEKTFNGAAATLYENRLLNIAILQAKGLLLIGTDTAVNNALTVKGGLGTDAKFQKTKSALPANQSVWAWLGSRLYQYQGVQTAALMGSLTTPVPGQEQTRRISENIYKVIDGIGFGLRNDGKTYAFDIAAVINVAEINKIEMLGELYSSINLTSKPLTFSLAKQIPDNALGVVYGANLAQLYKGFKAQIVAFQNLQAMINPGLDTPEAIKNFEEFETGLKDGLDIDFQADVLPWLSDEFAIYGVYNPTSDFAVTSKNQWPFDTVLVIKTTDKAKTKEVIGKLETLTGSVGLKPAKVGDGLLSFNFPQSAFRLGVGLVDDTLIVTSGTGIVPAADALKGKKALADSGIWKRTATTFPKNTAFAYYLDLAQVGDLLAKVADDSAPDEARIAFRVLAQFESAAVFSTGYADGITTSSATITLK